jgi:hypothetical protein
MILSSDRACMSQRDCAGTRTAGGARITSPWSTAGIHLRRVVTPMLSLRTWKIRSARSAGSPFTDTMPVGVDDKASTFADFVLEQQQAIIQVSNPTLPRSNKWTVIEIVLTS